MKSSFALMATLLCAVLCLTACSAERDGITEAATTEGVYPEQSRTESVGTTSPESGDNMPAETYKRLYS